MVDGGDVDTPGPKDDMLVFGFRWADGLDGGAGHA